MSFATYFSIVYVTVLLSTFVSDASRVSFAMYFDVSIYGTISVIIYFGVYFSESFSRIYFVTPGAATGAVFGSVMMRRGEIVGHGCIIFWCLDFWWEK